MERRAKRGPTHRRHGPPGPKPVKEGDVVEVKVVEKSRKGDGVARIERFVIFVPGGEPGQRLRIQIEKVGRSYAVGKIVI